jgi:hypothetical protein
VVKNDMHKIRGLHRVKNKNLIQKWVLGRCRSRVEKRVQQLKLCKHDKNSTRKIIRHKKKMCSKVSAAVAWAYFQQKTKICRSQSEI